MAEDFFFFSVKVPVLKSYQTQLAFKTCIHFIFEYKLKIPKITQLPGTALHVEMRIFFSFFFAQLSHGSSDKLRLLRSSEVGPAICFGLLYINRRANFTSQRR